MYGMNIKYKEAKIVYSLLQFFIREKDIQEDELIKKIRHFIYSATRFGDEIFLTRQETEKLIERLACFRPLMREDEHNIFTKLVLLSKIKYIGN